MHSPLDREGVDVAALVLGLLEIGNPRPDAVFGV